ncbi:MAG: ATP-binding protein [Pseudomonadota bacterium]|nr:ATP-binding protein [Pseudomonadota bacterium]
MCTGAEHRIAFVNQAFVELVGRDDLVDKTISEALPELEEQGFTRLSDRVFASGQPFQAHEMPLCLRRGEDGEAETRFIDFVYQAMRGSDGDIIGIFAAGYDVTDQKQAREEITLLQSDLIHLSRLSAMGTMASTLAHELNQPLTAISTYIAGCQRMLDSEGPLDHDTLSQALDRAKANALRAGEVIRRLRDMTMRGKTRRAPFNVCDAVTEACSLALIGVDERTIAKQLDVPRDIEAWGDRTQIQQVLLNLMRNAVEAMEGQTVRRLRVTASSSEKEVRLCVSDTGSGIEDAAQRGLFEAFSSTKPEGMGIGLSISRTIVENHGGRLWLEAGRPGATFCLTLAQRDAGR